MLKKLLLIVSGSIAAYKSLELIRLLRQEGVEVRSILTRGGAEFITPLSLASISGQPVYSDIFSLKDETEMGHIRLSREADLVLVAPASADILAKMAAGLADDLATTALLATDKPVWVAPAMNAHMWAHKATQRNIETLKADGVRILGPAAGELACGEEGFGRMLEPQTIAEEMLGFSPRAHSLPAAITPPAKTVNDNTGTLKGKRAIVTAGPTREALDPVRYLSNHSSGRQGYAIAAQLAEAGADVLLISGPTTLACPPGVRRVDVTSAKEMLKATLAALPADIAICTAAVADWRPMKMAEQKIKKSGRRPQIKLTDNPDILQRISTAPKPKRPHLTIGFAAETENLRANAALKLKKKKCDWILANDVSGGKVFGADTNKVYLAVRGGGEEWQEMTKEEVAAKLTGYIETFFSRKEYNYGKKQRRRRA